MAQKNFLNESLILFGFKHFGCVLGFDCHSSGLTTVVNGVLKQSIDPENPGISISNIKFLSLLEKNYNLPTKEINNLIYASKMSAKIDNAAIQDGFTLYHLVIFFDDYSNWTIIQQGLNKKHNMVRRYHWISDDLIRYIIEPHKGTIGNERIPLCLDMTSKESEENRKTCVNLIRGGSS